MGIIGTAIKNVTIPTGYIFKNGGNMDNRLIQEGTIVYLRDLHGVNGDGEMVGTGLEVVGKVTCLIDVFKNKKINWPIYEVDDYYFVNTCGKTCNQAILNGYKELYRLIVNNYCFSID